ncbi:MAG TPA: hypothetical protein VMD79_16290 [Solirubrobacteraceae bacterium]|nr:hypothetical protein [Solirubrobacteraceae bacterium]
MRAHPSNTSRRAVVARRRAAGLALAGLLALALAACGGGGSPSAATLVRDTFSAHKPIESGRIDLSFALTPLDAAGAPQPGRAFALRLQGPFQSLGPTRLPRFALALTLTSAGHTLAAGLTSTAGRLFVGLEGAYFSAPAATVQALQQGYAQATRAASAAASHSTFAALGVDPGEWIVRPRLAGSAEIGGAQATHVTGELDVARFLADAHKLSDASGALGLGASGQGLGVLSAAGISALSSSVRAASVDLYTGTRDHLLRRLSLTASISTAPQARAALGGLQRASLQLTLQFAGLDQPQAIGAPSNPQPISQLLPALERLGLAQGAGTAG